MGKQIKQIKIIDSRTIELEENASTGDYIVLTDINQKSVDTALLQQAIEQAKDNVYNAKLQEVRKSIQNEMEAKAAIELGKKNEEIARLQGSIEAEREKTKSSLTNDFNLKIRELESQLERAKTERILRESELKSVIESLKSEQEKNLEIAVKNERLATADNRNKLISEITSLKLENQHLTISKSSKNTKKQGEELEVWCNNEYKNYGMAFTNCLWYKDNIVVKGENEKGTKADYIFEIYSNEKHDEKDLLSKVVLEMKTEDPTSQDKNKKSNEYHLSKLATDMKNKKAEYGILVSELEWTADNDPLVQKSANYDNIYIVRPPYFVSFLSIISSLVLKYKEVQEDINREKIEFKNVIEINAEFENMKKGILDTSLPKLEKKIGELVSNNETLRTVVKSNDDALRIIIETHLVTIRNKITDFNIKKITKRVGDLTK